MRDWTGGIQEAMTRKFRVARQPLGQNDENNGRARTSASRGRGRGRQLEVNPREFIIDQAVEDNSHNTDDDYQYEEADSAVSLSDEYNYTSSTLPDLDRPYTQAENIYE